MPSKKPAGGSEPPPALYYTGSPDGQPHLSGIPSADLAPADVARLAHDHGLTIAAFVARATAGPFTLSARPAADESPSADGEE